mgnify:CR=1 FL=1
MKIAGMIQDRHYQADSNKKQEIYCQSNYRKIKIIYLENRQDMKLKACFVPNVGICPKDEYKNFKSNFELFLKKTFNTSVDDYIEGVKSNRLNFEKK